MLARSLLSNSNIEEVKIFYSYSRKDSSFRSLIDNVLGKFKWDVDVRTWYDGSIEPGAEWASEIDVNLNAADIVLLFITQRFVDSDYCMRVELPQALDNHNNRDCRVIPVIIEETTPDWRELPFAQLQVLPQNGRPLSQWSEADDAINNIAQGIVDIIAAANLDPQGRCRWQLHLAADKASFSLDDELNLVERLREISEDQTLRPRAIGEGSVVVLLESTYDGLRRVKRWFAEGEAAQLIGHPVKRIVELFGAGIHASSLSKTNRQGDAQSPQPDPSLLLFPSEEFAAATIKTITTQDGDPSSLNFIIDTGDSDNHQGNALEEESKRLIGYFKTALVLPEKNQWVNLAPDESNRMLGPHLEGTTMGRTLLESDYCLKRLSASLLHPDCESGSEFWRRVFEQTRADPRAAKAVYNTFQRVWIVPEHATVYAGEVHQFNPSIPPLKEGETQAAIVKFSLDVMCQHEYLNGYGGGDSSEVNWTNNICNRVFEDMILPLIKQEVNEGKTFAGLRQVYTSMILATWCKNEYEDDPKWARWIDSNIPLSTTIGRIEHLSGKTETESSGNGGSTSSSINSNDDEGKKPDLPPEICDDYSKSVNEAISLRESGELVKSQELLERAVSGRKNMHGAEHQLTMEATSQLGRTLRDMGQLEEARSLHETVLATRRKTLGPDHDFTVNSIDNLAHTLLKIGDVTAARELQAQAGEIRVRKSSDYNIPENREYFEKYLHVFREGVFHLVRDEFDPISSKKITRTYFSGAIDFRKISLKV